MRNKNKILISKSAPPLSTTASAHSASTVISNTDITADSGCTELLVKKSSAQCLQNRQPCTNLIVTVANNEKIVSSETGTLTIPTKLGDIVLTGYVFDDKCLINNLAGLSKLCNEGCTVTLDNETIVVSRDGENLWYGTKGSEDKLWTLDLADVGTQSFPLPTAPPMPCTKQLIEPATAFQAIRHDNDADFVQFVHAVFGSCPISTLQHAIDQGWLGNYPKITGRMLRQNPPVSRAMAMGYLDRTRQGLNSTKGKRPKRRLTRSATATASSCNDFHLDDDTDQSQLCFQVMTREEFMNSSDATGKFPFETLSGWNYILVSTMKGYVHLQLLRSRKAPEYRRAYKEMYTFYASLGKIPTTQRLDNETSGELESFLAETQVKIEYVAPGMHRQNPSERAIRPAKNCIIAMCHTVAPTFPAVSLLETVVDQAEIIINQLRPWHDDRSINAWTGMHNAPYDHLAHPLSIFGMQCVVLENPRPSWGPHGKDGYYVGPALQHYRCFRVLVTDTNSTRISDSIAWQPELYRMPGHSPLEVLTAATKDLLAAVRAIPPADKALLRTHTVGDTTVRERLSETVQLLQDMYTPNTTAPAVPPGFTPLIDNDAPVVPPSHLTATTTAPVQRVMPQAHQHQFSLPESTHAAAPAPRVPLPRPDLTETASPPLPVQTGAPTVPDHFDAAITEHLQLMAANAPTAPVSSDSTPDDLTYDWSPVNKKSLKTNERSYLRKINKLFTDENGPQRIVSVDRNHACTTGRGSRTLFYRFYNIIDFMAPPTNDNDYDHIPCAEMLHDPKIKWTSPAAQAQAMSASRTDYMNLTPDGSPLTHSSAIAGPNETEWRLEDDVEHRKLTTGTQTMHVIHKAAIPADRRKDVTYYNPQVKEKYKDNKWKRRVRGTVGGNLIHYKGKVTARTASLEVVRALLNSTLADDADFMAADITDYYLGTPLLRPEYMRMTRKQVSATIIEEYGYEDYFVNDVLYFQINKGMYGLPQAGILAQDRLVAHIAEHGYIQSDLVPCLFRHATNGISFVLVVDDFGIKYKSVSGRDHLLATLRLKYKITVDMENPSYLGMTIVHDKLNQTITCSMPGYIEKVLARFQDWAGTRTAKSPGIYTPPQYGAKVQYAHTDDTDPLSPTDIKTLQEIVGSMLYYARAVDPTMLTTTNTIASQQATPTQAVKAQAVKLLQYAAAYPNNAIVYKKSKMHVILQVDASYLSRSHARSVAGGVAYFGDADSPTEENGMIFAISSIIDVVVSSAGEAEYGAAFIFAQHGVGLRNIAIALGHLQPPTPILCDNQFAIGLATDTIKQKKSKSIDMRFHWLRDRIRQGQFTITHLAGTLNLADFFTKILPCATHQDLMPRLVHTPPPSRACHADGHWHTATRRRRVHFQHSQRAN